MFPMLAQSSLQTIPESYGYHPVVPFRKRIRNFLKFREDAKYQEFVDAHPFTTILLGQFVLATGLVISLGVLTTICAVPVWLIYKLLGVM